ncbi:MAG: hypothetical protein EXS15_02600 [Phycisphaerales bacterium]|nr:hypothetical protein [Phycisphaerales bacterium]
MRDLISIALTAVCLLGCGDDATPPTLPATPTATPSAKEAPATATPEKPAKSLTTRALPVAPAVQAPSAAATDPTPPAAGVESGSVPVAIAPPPPKTPTRKGSGSSADSQSSPPIPETALADVPPELHKYAILAATQRFQEFTKLAAERHTLQLRASQIRLEMRGVVATAAQEQELASVQSQVGRVGDRMDSYVMSQKWSQDELVTMDFIISEQMRLRPPPG